MGRARILVDGAVGALSQRDWDCEGYTKHAVKIKPGYGLKQATKLAKLVGGQINTLPGKKAYTLKERKAIFQNSQALTDKQINSGDFEVAVVEW